MTRRRSPAAAAALVAALALDARALAADRAPELKAQTLDGRQFSLSSLQGRVVVLDFWASWCLPCRASFPVLDGLAKKYEARGLSVVGVSLDSSRDAAIEFLQSVPVSFTIAHDPSGGSGEAFHVVSMPTTLLVDREGRVAARFEGGGKKVHRKLEAAIEALLGGRPLPDDVDVRAAAGAESTGGLKAWQRGYLADPMMDLNGNAIDALLHEHVHASKEGAAGDGGPAGGGCGCN